MARQSGFIKLSGTLGDITFYKIGTDHYAKLKSSLDGDRVKNAKEFERTRENNSEFGKAVKAIKQIKDSISNILLNDRFYFSRLTKTAMQVIQGDGLNDRGERNIINGEVKRLIGFRFIESTGVDILGVNIGVSYNNASGALDIEVPEYTPNLNLVRPAGATHYKLKCAATEHNFEQEGFERYFQETDYIDVTSVDARQNDNFPFALTPGTDDLVCVVFVIQFYQLVSGSYYPLETGDACSIIFAQSNAESYNPDLGFPPNGSEPSLTADSVTFENGLWSNYFGAVQGLALRAVANNVAGVDPGTHTVQWYTNNVIVKDFSASKLRATLNIDEYFHSDAGDEHEFVYFRVNLRDSEGTVQNTYDLENPLQQIKAHSIILNDTAVGNVDNLLEIISGKGFENSQIDSGKTFSTQVVQLNGRNRVAQVVKGTASTASMQINEALVDTASGSGRLYFKGFIASDTNIRLLLSGGPVWSTVDEGTGSVNHGFGAWDGLDGQKLATTAEMEANTQVFQPFEVILEHNANIKAAIAMRLFSTVGNGNLKLIPDLLCQLKA